MSNEFRHPKIFYDIFLRGRLSQFVFFVLTAIFLIWWQKDRFDIEQVPKCSIKEEIRTVRGTSMEPAIGNGSEVTALFDYYACHDINHNDLVLYHYAGNEAPLIKTVKAVPGDVFGLVSGSNGSFNLSVNNNIVVNSQNIPYVFSGKRYRIMAMYERDYRGVIPKDAYLLLGDQHDGSTDSGVFGLVSKADILGRAVLAE